MMIVCEHEFLKAHAELDKLIEMRTGHVCRSHVVRGIQLIQAFVTAAGDSDMGDTMEIR